MHLILNHLPVVTLLIALSVWFWGLFLSWEPARRIGLALFFVGGLLAVPAFFSGERAEEEMESVLSAEEAFIEEHEEAAKLALILCLITAGAAGFSFFLKRKGKGSASRSLEFVTAGLSIVAFLVVARAAHFGGMIRHPEIRGTQAMDLPTQSSPGEEDLE